MIIFYTQNGYSALLVAAFDQPAVVKMLLAVPSIKINFQAVEVRIALCTPQQLPCMHQFFASMDFIIIFPFITERTDGPH